MSDELKAILGSGPQLMQGALARGEAAAAKLRRATQGESSVADPAKQREIEKAATDFEALMMQEMLKSMWSTVKGDGMLTGSREEELYRDFLNQELSKEIAEHQSFGIKEMIARDINKLSEPKK